MVTIHRRRGKSISKQAYPRALRRQARDLAAAVAAELEIELAEEFETSSRLRAGLATFGAPKPEAEPADLLAYLVSE